MEHVHKQIPLLHFPHLLIARLVPLIVPRLLQQNNQLIAGYHQHKMQSAVLPGQKQ